MGSKNPSVINECENWKMLEAMIFRLYNKSCMINEKDPRMKVNLVSGFWLFLTPYLSELDFYNSPVCNIEFDEMDF